MKQTRTQKLRAGSPGSGIRPGAGRRTPGAGNLVSEIVDQIARKQSAAARAVGPHRSTAETCAFCLDPAVAGSAYRIVLQCEAGGEPTSDD